MLIAASAAYAVLPPAAGARGELQPELQPRRGGRARTHACGPCTQPGADCTASAQSCSAPADLVVVNKIDLLRTLVSRSTTSTQTSARSIPCRDPGSQCAHRTGLPRLVRMAGEHDRDCQPGHCRPAVLSLGPASPDRSLAGGKWPRRLQRTLIRKPITRRVRRPQVGSGRTRDGAAGQVTSPDTGCPSDRRWPGSIPDLIQASRVVRGALATGRPRPHRSR